MSLRVWDFKINLVIEAEMYSRPPVVREAIMYTVLL